jgi:hypothetical protein
MMPWNERPPEIANLFNPAFCGILLARAVRGFISEAAEGMPFALAFLTLPIVLHEQTRNLLPKTKSTWMIQWLQRNPEVRVGFAARTRSLVPCTRESLMFMSAQGHIVMEETGRLVEGTPIGRIGKLERESDEFKKCVSKAELIGKMLAKAGKPGTIFALWGVRP